jgi:ankyrin repeat protein
MKNKCKTAMNRAVQSGMIEMVDLLVGAKGDINLANSVDGWTPFHCAVMDGNINMVKHLLKLKANPLAVTTSGMTAVHIAAAYDRSHLFQILTSSFECGIG